MISIFLFPTALALLPPVYLIETDTPHCMQHAHHPLPSDKLCSPGMVLYTYTLIILLTPASLSHTSLVQNTHTRIHARTRTNCLKDTMGCLLGKYMVTVAEQAAYDAALEACLEGLTNAKDTAAMRKICTAFLEERIKVVAPGSWTGHPSSVEGLPAFGGGAGVDVALALAEKHGLKDSILACRVGVARGLYRLVLTGCLAVGDSRTHYSGPLGDDNWSSWVLAGEPSMPGYELGKMVLDAIVALQTSPSVEALGKLVNQLSALVFDAIPEGDDAGGGGGGAGALQDMTTHPEQALAFLMDIKREDGSPYCEYGGAIPMANYTPQMHVEIKGGVAKLKAGLCGDPAEFDANGRHDLDMIMSQTLEGNKKIDPSRYLQVLGINRFETFHAKGLEVALAAGGDASSYSAGPLKHEERIYAKCGPGGDYHSRDDDRRPFCKWVMDPNRGTVKCKTRSMMVRATAAAVKIFGEPAVVKDRRTKVQHDVLMVFDHEGLYVEVQFHYEDTLAVKVLAHAIFEIQRLKAGVDEDGDAMTVLSSGLSTVVELPEFSESAADAEVLLHI